MSRKSSRTAALGCALLGGAQERISKIPGARASRPLGLLALSIAVLLTQACTGSRPTQPLNAGARENGAPVQLTLSPTRLMKSWRSAARVSDWPGVARRIDALLEPERTEPGVRYVRAVTAIRLGDWPIALSALDELGPQLPLLGEEIAEMTARCQLEIGPFEAAATYFTSQGSAAAKVDAALAWKRAGQLERARELLDQALASMPSKRATDPRQIAARRLRVEIAEQLGQQALARKHYRWLAMEAALPDADDAYEKLARSPLSKGERFARTEALAARGDIAGVTRELALMRKAPGKPPGVPSLLRARATAHYRSRSDDAQAAALFEEAARLSGDAGVRDLFAAARAWSRASQVDRALAIYRQLAAQYPGTPQGRRAEYRLARLSFTAGRWDAAERAYTHYLRRYGRKTHERTEVVNVSRYERALTQLAAGRADAALRGFQGLLRSAGGGYRQSMLRHLEAVALETSGVASQQTLAVERFEAVIRDYPLSFAALASAARLEQLGRVAAPLPPLVPPAAPGFEELPDLLPKARLLSDLGLYSAAERALHAEERTLRRHFSPRGAEALCGLYGSVDRGWRRYALATTALSANVLRRAPTATNLWAWQCLFPRPYGEAVARLEQRHRLPAGLIHSVMRQESAFRPDARSPAGATGLMQLMPKTAARAGGELALPYHPERLNQVQYNLELGTYYLGKLLDSFDRRVVLALASYNAGPHAVSRWLDGNRGLPLDLWVAQIPYSETRHYVMRVLDNWARYQHLANDPLRMPRLALAVPAGSELADDAY